jgi:hypothetical protein
LSPALQITMMISTIKTPRKKPKAIALRNGLINALFRPHLGDALTQAEICCSLLFAGHGLCPAVLLAMPERTLDLGVAAVVGGQHAAQLIRRRWTVLKFELGVLRSVRSALASQNP